MTKETIKDAQKKTLTAMANVNAVDGFDPRLVTSCFQDAEGNNRMYLQAEPAMLWFRLKHPGGRLEQIVYRANDQMNGRGPRHRRKWQPFGERFRHPLSQR